MKNHKDLEKFLLNWELSAKSILAENHVEVDKSKFELINAGANSKIFSQLEKRFSLELPEQFRRFYSVTNGLNRITIDGSIHELLLGLDEVVEYSVLSPEAVENWIGGEPSNISDEFYFVYGKEQKPYNVRLEYLRSAIALSKENANSTILLNREIIFESGEFEIWDLSPYIDGAVRYNSFYSFLESACKSNLQGLRSAFSIKRQSR